ncbi:hypothetical protein L1O48_07730 [Ligilactobacillus equi]|uniref:hypothetical protein n=1 Tax=Ligilactobacillus equi TaxID=137357 RepID=UPI002ED5B4FF
MINQLVTAKLSGLLKQYHVTNVTELVASRSLVENLNRAYETGDILEYAQAQVAPTKQNFEAIYADEIIFQIWDGGDLEIYGDESLWEVLARII